MHSLPLFKTEVVDQLAHAALYKKVTLSSPATTIFTDFTEHEPLVIDYDAKAESLEHLMKKSHVKMKLVLDKKGVFIGIVTAADLSERHIVQKVAQGTPRESLTAFDFMRAKSTLHSFDFEHIKHATVGDIVETLKHNGQHHCLVIDRNAHVIRGVISVSDIARELHAPLDIQSQPSFAALSRIVAA